MLAERVEEYALLKARLVEAEVYAEEREPLIAKLRKGLALAETLLAERDAEIERLRAGLAHAETLAFDRARELADLQKSWGVEGPQLPYVSQVLEGAAPSPTSAPDAIAHASERPRRCIFRTSTCCAPSPRCWSSSIT